MAKSVIDQIRRIELRLSVGEDAQAIKLLRELVDNEGLDATMTRWAIQLLNPYGEESRVGRLLKKLFDLDPKDEAVGLRYADFMREAGHFDEAEEAYRDILCSNSASGHALYYLATMRKLASDELPDNPAVGASPEDQVLTQFAMGKVAEDEFDYKRAIHHFDLANEIGARNIPNEWRRFDDKRTNAEDNQIRGQFAKSLLEKWSPMGSPTDRSIFVIGLPRSGTTLLERILSGHPDVHASGELSYWTKRGRELLGDPQARPPKWRPMAEGYEKLLDVVAPSATKVIDKNPMNAKLAGALHVLMPNARFIWCNRHPVDHCLSMYKTFGGAPKDMAFSRRLLVDGYRLNDLFRQYWAAVIPADRFLEISYEQLVTENEATARRVVQFCGLEWSANCLSDRSRGSVRTPSAWQVRQPIYTSSLNVWRNYEPWLREFGELCPAI